MKVIKAIFLDWPIKDNKNFSSTVHLQIFRIPRISSYLVDKAFFENVLTDLPYMTCCGWAGKCSFSSGANMAVVVYWCGGKRRLWLPCTPSCERAQGAACMRARSEPPPRPVKYVKSRREKIGNLCQVPSISSITL